MTSFNAIADIYQMTYLKWIFDTMNHSFDHPASMLKLYPHISFSCGRESFFHAGDVALYLSLLLFFKVYLPIIWCGGGCFVDADKMK